MSPLLQLHALNPEPAYSLLSHLSTSWALRLGGAVTRESVLVRVEVPRELPHCLRVRAGVSSPDRVFVSLDQVLPANALQLFLLMVRHRRRPTLFPYTTLFR